MIVAKTSPAEDAMATRAGRPLVLCVDDEPQILNALTRLLRREEIELRTTGDPEMALEWTRTREVALLIADFRMPLMSGTTLLQLVKDASPRTRRIMLTGYPGESTVISAGAAGLMDLVGKPWDDEALKQMILERLGPEAPEADGLQ
jgi:DNA-binding NtrC family response regulator